MLEKKKIAFYGILSSGHLNLCSAVASTLLNLYSDEIDVYFFVDHNWEEKLSKVDSRFKFEVFEYKNEEEKNYVAKFVKFMEPTLSLSNMEKLKVFLNLTIAKDNGNPIDDEIFLLIKKIKPDYLLCDRLSHMASVVASKIPYSFIISCNPLLLDIEGLPYFGLDCGVEDKKRIKLERNELKEIFEKAKKNHFENYEKKNVIFDKDIPIHSPRSDNLSIYCYPKELDYFDDEMREKYKLLQVDAPVVPSRIPPPYELPEEFSKLPGKIIYVSLGSLFSLYHTKLQKLIDTLATLPYKYIVSKGPAGEKINFPNNRFIGENFVNQLAVLQVVDMMIAHGGNNTFTECFYFGVPSIIFPVMCDQVNNAKRIEETEFGFQLELMNYTQTELKEKIEKILSNDFLIEKMKKVSERIEKENSLESSVKKFYKTFKKKFQNC